MKIKNRVMKRSVKLICAIIVQTVDTQCVFGGGAKYFKRLNDLKDFLWFY